jgi:hypothetical protein
MKFFLPIILTADHSRKGKHRHFFFAIVSRFVRFWKYSKILNIFRTKATVEIPAPSARGPYQGGGTEKGDFSPDLWSWRSTVFCIHLVICQNKHK